MRKGYTEMKIALSLLICVSISFVTCRVDKLPEDSQLLGSWEGRNEQGKIEVLLTVDTGYLVFEYIESGKSIRHSYTLYEGFYEGARTKEIKIEGIFEERFIVRFIDENTMRLDLSEDNARKPDVPSVSMVTFHRRK